MKASAGEAPVANGRLRYETAGSGPALVFVHGFSLDRRLWDSQWRVFSRTHRCVRYDCRGFGDSTQADRATDPEGSGYRHGDDLVALLDHLDIAHAAVVGLSMGGEVALEATLRHPDRCSRLVVVDGFLSAHAFSAEWKAIIRRVVEAARQGDVAEARRRWLGSPLFAPACEQPEVAARLREMVEGYSGWHWQHRDPGRFEVPAEKLATIEAPTLIVIGDRDLADFHAIARQLAAAIPGSRLARLPTGHVPNLEAPERFDALLAAFLAEPGGRAR